MKRAILTVAVLGLLAASVVANGVSPLPPIPPPTAPPLHCSLWQILTGTCNSGGQ